MSEIWIVVNTRFLIIRAFDFKTDAMKLVKQLVELEGNDVTHTIYVKRKVL